MANEINPSAFSALIGWFKTATGFETRHTRCADGGELHVVKGAMTPLGYDQITNMVGATGLTVPPGARLAYIDSEGGSVRWRDDGTDPTATVGKPISSGFELEYEGDLAAIKFFPVSGTPILNVVFYG